MQKIAPDYRVCNTVLIDPGSGGLTRGYSAKNQADSRASVVSSMRLA